MRKPTAFEGLIRAAATLVAVVASFGTTFALCRWAEAQPAPAIVSAIIAISLSRRAKRPNASHPLLTFLAVACVAPVAAGVAWLLHVVPILGAAVFIAGMFASIWLRNFGLRAAGIGALIALPLVAILIVPARAHAPGGPVVDLALIVAAGVVALLYVTVVQAIVGAIGRAPAAAPPVGPPQQRTPRAGMPIATRMALQMTVALGAAFLVGFLVFPGHWGWTVVTAFIVSSGARGRGDAAYKGVMRLIGALGGTIGAGILANLGAPSGPPEAALIFAVLFLALWLRDYNYAYWAAAITLILALLARSGEVMSIALLGVRLESILAGAVCAVVAAWFVFPIRTSDVIRRRLADALLAFDELVAHAHAHVPESERDQKRAIYEHRMNELESVAAPVRWHRRLWRIAPDAEHPAHWIDLANRLRSHARALPPERYEDEGERTTVRRAIGISRRAIGNHGKADASPEGPSISKALERLHDLLGR